MVMPNDSAGSAIFLRLEEGDNQELRLMAMAYLTLAYDYDGSFLTEMDWAVIVGNMRGAVTAGKSWDEILDAAGEYARRGGVIPSVDDVE